MLKMLETCRHLWNDALSHRKERWQNERKSTSYDFQQWILTAERHTDTELGSLHSQVAQDVIRRLDRAFKTFFQHKAGYPKFKRFREWGSFTYPQAYNGSVKPDNLRKRLFLSKVGNIRIVLHRPLPKDSTMKTCTVVRESDGRWFASMVFEDVVPLQDVAPLAVMPRAPVGIDLGLLSMITTSDGDRVEHPRLLRKAEKRLKHVQHTLSHKRRGSKNWFKARQRLASQHARVRRRRLDFNHKLSAQLMKEHGFVAFEDLKVRNMVRNHSLAKSIQDAGWGQLVRLTAYKASKAGELVVKVEPAYSTQECFHCGARNRVSLQMREFECVACHRILDRDINAAKIVLKRGLTQVGLDRPELKPVETRPLSRETTPVASPVVEAGTIRAGDVRALEAHGFCT